MMNTTIDVYYAQTFPIHNLHQILYTLLSQWFFQLEQKLHFHSFNETPNIGSNPWQSSTL